MWVFVGRVLRSSGPAEACRSPVAGRPRRTRPRVIDRRAACARADAVAASTNGCHAKVVNVPLRFNIRLIENKKQDKNYS